MARTTPTTGIGGPNGIRITSAETVPNAGLISIPVKPFYLDTAGTRLSNLKASANSYSLYLGGVLSEVPAPKQVLASGDIAYAFDTLPVDNKLDSFFLNTATINLPTITALGVVADNVKVTVKDLSNHPDLLKLKGLAAGDWLGSVTLSGSKVTFPSVPNLTITPKASGADAFSASYNIATGDLGLALSKVAYTSPQATVALSDSTLTLRNSAKDLSLSGKVDLSLPTLGLAKLSGNLESFTIVNSAVETLKASLSSTTPIGPLGLSGTIAVDQNFKTNTGTISVTNGTIAGINVSGNLSYTNTGNPAVDSITGRLSFDNSVARNDLDFDALGLSLVPLSGTVDYVYRPVGASSPGTTLTFSNVNFDLVTGAVTTSFSGNMTLKVDANSKISLDQMELNLLNPPKTLAIKDLGQFKLEALAANNPVKFALQRYTLSNGTQSALMPIFTGKLSYSSDGGNVYGSIGGLAWKPIIAGDPSTSAWTILNAEVVIAFS